MNRVLLIAGVFAAVFAGYTLAVYLSRAATGLIKPEFVAILVAMKVGVATEIIIPISVFIAVLFGVEGLRRSQETTAMRALGFGPRQALGGLMWFFFGVAAVVGVLSVWGRPWIYQQYYVTVSRAEAAFDLDALEPDRFYVGPEGQRVVLVDERDGDRLKGVFMWTRGEGEELVLRAGELIPSGAKGPQGFPVVETRNLRMWRVTDKGSALAGDADELTASVDFGGVAPLGFKRKAAPTSHLAGSTDGDDIAEFQWRISRPISAFLLGLLAFFVASWNRSPGGSFRTIALGAVTCLGYYLVSLTARNWVREERVGAWPGLWWVDALLAVVLLVLYLRRGYRRVPRRPKQKRANA